jgi:chorismate-pyruvate lyase
MGNHAAPTKPEPELPCFDAPPSRAAVTHDLTGRYFALQDQRPANLGDVELLAMDSALRNLLFTDGTVTRTLEAHALSRVCVDVAAQSRCAASRSIARHLDTPTDTESVRRRVTISLDASPMPVIWAESHILPERLPAGFLNLLDNTPDGIGESLQQIKLEGWREMLWFGLDAPPSWDSIASYAAPMFLTRLYRIITLGRPALLISESFAVEQTSGSFHLTGLR